jgi:hypothetical protein
MRHTLLTLLAAVTVLVAGCGDEAGQGTLVLHLTDAPYPFEFVQSTEVAIDSVTVRMASGGFVTVDRTPRVVDLMELQNGVSLTLGSAAVPADEIEQIRVYVGDATVTLTDARTFPLKFPSGASSGVKVVPSPPIEVADGGTVDALIDFDLSSSFSATPASPQRVEDIRSFLFHPVLRVSNLVDVGGVSGTIRGDAGTPGVPADDLPLPNASVVASQAGADVTSTMADENGRYVMLGLVPGVYTVAASLTGFAPDSASVSVTAAAEAPGVDLLLAETP